jgi:hypothetical protein
MNTPHCAHLLSLSQRFIAGKSIPESREVLEDTKFHSHRLEGSSHCQNKEKSELVNVDNPIDTKQNKGSNYPSKIEHDWPRSVDVSFLHTTDPQELFLFA